MTVLQASDLAPGLLVAPGVEIPDNVEIDPYVTIYAGVVLGAGARLGQSAVIGRPQRIDANSQSPRRPPDEPTFIGTGCMIGGGATMLPARIGKRCVLADLVLIREAAVLDVEVMVGRGSVRSPIQDLDRSGHAHPGRHDHRSSD